MTVTSNKMLVKCMPMLRSDATVTSNVRSDTTVTSNVRSDTTVTSNENCPNFAYIVPLQAFLLSRKIGN